MREYEYLRSVIESNGFFTKDREASVYGNALICASKKRAKGGLTGNSFWVVTYKDQWFLVSWGTLYYRVVQPESLERICLEWLANATWSGGVPRDLVDKQLLEEVGDDDFHDFFKERLIPAVLAAIHHRQGVFHDRTHRYAQSLQELESLVKPPFAWRSLPRGSGIELTAETDNWVATVRDSAGRRFSIDQAGELRDE